MAWIIVSFMSCVCPTMAVLTLTFCSPLHYPKRSTESCERSLVCRPFLQLANVFRISTDRVSHPHPHRVPVQHRFVLSGGLPKPHTHESFVTFYVAPSKRQKTRGWLTARADFCSSSNTCLRLWARNFLLFPAPPNSSKKKTRPHSRPQ